ncbi:MAG: sulfatase-like hydrolase/transferase [Planctomycetota bacterium]
MQKKTADCSRRAFLKLAGGTVVVSSLGCRGLATAIEKPAKPQPPQSKKNIVLIMADDVGYECFGCYGSNMYTTPHIDALAANGVRFTHCYAQPLCTPSRVKIMTGQSNIRNYVDFSIMDPAEKTFGHMMQAHGYKTCVAGKWQLYGAEHYGPQTRGKGILPGDAGFDAWCLWQVEKLGDRYWNPRLNVNGQVKQYGKEQYGPDVCADFINEFITAHKDTPFFVYYPMILVHSPFEPTPDSPSRKQKHAQKNFWDMVSYMDKLVGRIVAHLKDAGVLENTLILFLSDNGTDKKIKSRLNGQTITGGKSITTDSGTRVPFVASCAAAAKGTVCDDLIDLSDFVPTMAEATGAALPADVTLDGRSFLPQIRGDKGDPRQALFMYYNPRPTRKDWSESRFARDQRFKLYGDGRLYDVPNDMLEKKPIAVGEGGPEAAAARERLQRVIDSMPAKPVKITGKKLR